MAKCKWCKSVLISIQPYWVFLIIAKVMGWYYTQEKTIEVRKTYPKDKEWNKIVEIYCTKDKASFNRIPKKYQPLMEKFLGKVVGEFVCDRIDTIVSEQLPKNHESYEGRKAFYDSLAYTSFTRISYDELSKYVGYGLSICYGWHISDLTVYDKPKELSEFTKCNLPSLDKLRGSKILCDCCIMTNYGETENFGFNHNGYYDCGEISCGTTFEDYIDDVKNLKRPPQSWCYVVEA